MEHPLTKKKQVPSRQPHFLQPMLPGFATKLDIPVTFYEECLMTTEECSKQKKRVVKLWSGRRRKAWKVGLVGRRIVDGWREFCEAHELKVLNFLVFKYVGNLGFVVSVFDKIQCEVEYQVLDHQPPDGNPNANTNVNVNVFADVESEDHVAKEHPVEERKG